MLGNGQRFVAICGGLWLAPAVCVASCGCFGRLVASAMVAELYARPHDASRSAADLRFAWPAGFRSSPKAQQLMRTGL
eukprot:11185647-Alexandrium_andersonii.AAC.1